MNFATLIILSCMVNAILCVIPINIGNKETVCNTDVVRDDRPHLELILRTSKRAYREGEEIGIIVYLENTASTESYYIARDLTGLFVHNPFHGIQISILDSKNKDITRYAVADPMPGKEVLKIEEIPSHYLVLGPTMIYGVRDSNDLDLKPGKYKLLAKYYEAAAFRLTETELKSISPPIWVKDITSNAVIIRVTR